MTTTTSCCGSTTTCTTESVLRPRFFPRQINTPDDLTLMQDYFRSRLRWHNRIMHGWGVVCGALVCPAPSPDGSGPLPWTVIVRTGYALGPCGDDIIIDCDRTIDLRTSGVTGVTGEACVEPVDPWCTEVYQPDRPRKVYIAVRYKEVMTRPVRVQPFGCGCDDSRCEYSRWRDGYEIGVLTACPCPPTDPPPVFVDLPTGPTPACPCRPETNWVGLAEVDVNADGFVTTIDNCSCRRLVVSFGRFWWECQGEQAITFDPNQSNTIAQGKSVDLQFTAKNLQASATPDLGSDISISKLAVDTTKGTIAFTATASANSALGSRTLTVRNGDCTWGTLPDAIEIVAPTAAVKTAAPKKTPADKSTRSNGG
jgi:hypothetical protein